MPPIQLRPRSGGAAPSVPHTARRPLIRHLAGGGLLGALGDAFYKYVPPIHVPVSNVQAAAPVDVAAAWDAADSGGLAAGDKALAGYTTSMKEVFDKQKIAPAYRAELTQRHAAFLQKQQQRLASDPAFFNSRANQMLVQQESQELIDPTRIAANANEFEQWGDDEKHLRTNNQLSDVALDAQGNPMDQTYGEMFNVYQTEESSNVLRQFFPLKQDGSSGKVSGTPFRMTLPSGTHDQAYAEVNQLEEKIKPWSSETGTSSLSEQVPAGLQSLWQQAGGGAYGMLKTDHRTKEEQNLEIIKKVTQQLATGNTWRTLLSPNAAQSLLAEQYRAVAKKDSNFGQTLGIKNSTLPLEGGALRLGSNHLEARQKLLERLRQRGTSEADQKTLAEAYGKLRAYDLTQAEQQVRENLIDRLKLKKYYSSSDVTDKSLQTGGVKPDATKADAGYDLPAAVKYGTGLDFTAPNTTYEVGKDAAGKPVMSRGLPYWSSSIPGSGQMHDYMVNLTTTTDSEGKAQARSLGELVKNGMGVYNAHSMRGIARPGGNDPALDKIKILPGAGQFTYLPHDPRELQLKATRDKIALLAKEANDITNAIKQATSTGNQQLLQQLEGAKAQNLAKATAAGLVPAFRVRAVSRQQDLSRNPGFTNSVESDYDVKRLITPFGYGVSDLDAKTTQATGVRSISSDEASKAGFDSSWYKPGDNYVEFDTFVTDPNFHMIGGEKSQMRNSSTNNAVQQNQAGQNMQATQAAATNW